MQSFFPPGGKNFAGVRARRPGFTVGAGSEIRPTGFRSDNMPIARSVDSRPLHAVEKPGGTCTESAGFENCYGRRRNRGNFGERFTIVLRFQSYRGKTESTRCFRCQSGRVRTSLNWESRHRNANSGKITFLLKNSAPIFIIILPNRLRYCKLRPWGLTLALCIMSECQAPMPSKGRQDDELGIWNGPSNGNLPWNCHRFFNFDIGAFGIAWNRFQKFRHTVQTATAPEVLHEDPIASWRSVGLSTCIFEDR